MVQLVSLILATLGTITGAVALWVNRANARDETATKATSNMQSLAHQELVDALSVQHDRIDEYREQVEDTRKAIARQQRQMVEMRKAHTRQMNELRKEHEQCQVDLGKLTSELRIAETRIAELGG